MQQQDYSLSQFDKFVFEFYFIFLFSSERQVTARYRLELLNDKSVLNPLNLRKIFTFFSYIYGQILRPLQ